MILKEKNLKKLLPTTTRTKISLPNHIRLVRIFFLSVFLSIFILGCKEKDFAELNVQPDNDKLGATFFSTNDIISYTLKDDSSAADERAYNLLGSYVDPIFGVSEASFTSQFILSSVSPDFNVVKNGITIPPTIDSVVLSLVYNSAYGDLGKLNGLQRIEVYELQKVTNIDSSYSSNFNVDTCYTSSNLIGSKLVLPNLTKSVVVDSIAQIAQLRIKLDTATFGKKIMGLLPNTSDFLKSNEEFKKYFKGIYVKTNNQNQSTSQGGIIYFDLLSSSGFSRITTYYHNDTIQSGSFDYVISSSECARISIFKHKYANAPLIQNQLQNSSLGQNQVFIQAMAGLRTKIEIPLLKQLADSGNIAISKAEIIFKIDEPFTGKYVPNAWLVLSRIDSNGVRAALPDFFESAAFSGDYYGGVYDQANQQYRFNIARYVQLVATKKYQDYGFYLETGATSNTANRVVLKGGKNIQFNLTYIKL
jgi:Domain of unknown function (DUF4270)